MTTATTMDPTRTVWENDENNENNANTESKEERNKATIRRVFAEFVNQGDFSVVDELYRPDIVDHEGL
ncbi:hypothetical protein ACWC21_28115, partial [Streptomyces sp. NPDC001348]